MNDENLFEPKRSLSALAQPAPGGGYWYMAGPYSDSIAERYKQHLDALAVLTRHNITVYSPIVQYHGVAHTYNLPTDALFWEEHNYNMILGSKGVILLCLSNWADSRGVRKELTYSKQKGISVWALDPPDYYAPNIALTWTHML